jgi:plastocyanin
MSQKLSILAVIGLVVVGAVGYWAWTSQQPEEQVRSELPGTQDAPEGAHVVTLTEDGFVPSQLSIRVGDTVAFKTSNNDLFWPASNLHPSHGIYPEFDPLGPVQPTHVWSFTFDKAGEWKYHDHLAPYYTGVITVTE